MSDLPTLYVPQGEIDTLDGDGCLIAYPTIALAGAENARGEPVVEYVPAAALKAAADFAAKCEADLERTTIERDAAVERQDEFKRTGQRIEADSRDVFFQSCVNLDRAKKAESDLVAARESVAKLVDGLREARKHVSGEHIDCRGVGCMYDIPGNLSDDELNAHPDVLEYCTCDYRQRVTLRADIDALIQKHGGAS